MEKILLRKGYAKAFPKVFIFLCCYLKFTIFNSFAPLSKLHFLIDYLVFCFTKPNIWPGTTGDCFAVTPLCSLVYTCAFHLAFLLPKTPDQSTNHKKSFRSLVKGLGEMQPASWSPAGLEGLITNKISFLVCSMYSLLYCWSQLKINWNKYNLFRKVTIETTPENSL